jgi:hypothetical protein
VSRWEGKGKGGRGCVLYIQSIFAMLTHLVTIRAPCLAAGTAMTHTRPSKDGSEAGIVKLSEFDFGDGGGEGGCRG